MFARVCLLLYLLGFPLGDASYVGIGVRLSCQAAAVQRNQAIRTREVLEAAMTAEGWIGHPREWWHFDDPDWEAHPVLDIALGESPL